MAEGTSKDVKPAPDLTISEDVLVPYPDSKSEKEDKMIQKSSEHENDEEDSESEDDEESSEEDSDSDLSDLEYMCKICSKTFSGYIPLRQHEKSGKHSKAVKKKKREKMLKKKLITDEEALDEKDDYLFIKKPYSVCQPCGKYFSGPEAYDQHLKSKSHKRKLMEKNFLDRIKEKGEITNELLLKFITEKQSGMKSDPNEDDDCQAFFESLQRNMASKKPNDDDSDEEKTEEYECEICDKVFSGFIPYSQHIISKVHAKTVKRKAAISEMIHKSQASTQSADAPSSKGIKDLSSLEVDDDSIMCKLCSMAFSGPENAMAHLKSRGHSKKLKAKMWKLSRNQNSGSFCSETGSEDPLPSRKESLQSDKLSEVESDDTISIKITESKLGKLDISATAQQEEAQGGVVVDSGQSSVQENKEDVSYSKYKEYKEIMNESDVLL